MIRNIKKLIDEFIEKVMEDIIGFKVIIVFYLQFNLTQ
ncbi:hypothetical protein ES703_106647 [subsurface metagenome]